MNALQTIILALVFGLVVIFVRRSRYSEPALTDDGQIKKCPRCTANLELVSRGSHRSEQCTCGYIAYL